LRIWSDERRKDVRRMQLRYSNFTEKGNFFKELQRTNYLKFNWFFSWFISSAKWRVQPACTGLCQSMSRLYKQSLVARCDRIVFSTLRCGRRNPGLNPGHGKELPFQKGCILNELKPPVWAKKLNNSSIWQSLYLMVG
jgi:hypothetical protein